MFGIGMNFRLRRLREMGLPLIITTALTAFLVFNIGKIAGQLAGLGKVESIFLAGMLLSSSSAVIGKVLSELNVGHQRHGQLALGITLLEDIVAVVMITFLSSYVTIGGQPADAEGGLFGTVGVLLSFVLLLVVGGLLLVPKLIDSFHRTRLPELETLLVMGLVFSISLLAVKAGYSLALGAFLLGAIVAETPQASALTRSLEGMRDVFSTVFFVAVGMTIDLSVVPESFGFILMLTVICLIGRPLAAAIALVVVCEDGKTALRTGLSVTPMGEFGFIIASLGIAGGILGPQFQVMAVGAALATALLTPLLVRHSDWIANKILKLTPQWLEEGLAVYRKIWQTAGQRRDGNLLWKLGRKRVIQIGVEITFVTAVLLFSVPVLNALEGRVPDNYSAWAHELLAVYWIVVGLLCAAPLLAIWRNCSALILIVVDSVSNSRPVMQRINPVIISLLRTIVAIVLILWFWNFIPFEIAGIWVIVAVALLLVAMLVLGRRKLIYWHSQMEFTLQAAFEEETGRSAFANESLKRAREQLNLVIGEVLLPDNFLHAGRSIQDLNLRRKTATTVVGIERQGYPIHNPGPQAHLFPGDRLFLLGTQESILNAEQILKEEGTVPERDASLADLSLETVELQSDNFLTRGLSLEQMNLTRIHGIQVVGAVRDGKKNNPPRWAIYPRGGRYSDVDGQTQPNEAFPEAMLRRRGLATHQKALLSARTAAALFFCFIATGITAAAFICCTAGFSFNDFATTAAIRAVGVSTAAAITAGKGKRNQGKSQNNRKEDFFHTPYPIVQLLRIASVFFASIWDSCAVHTAVGYKISMASP
ncbi:MAG: cation:proton antiporter [Verrucomicrobia bacterium]|nr:cation:proton antiporter [Verrucomicrobiota bacterium]